MAKDNEIQLLYRVAKRYYEDDMLQSAIAEMEGISRPQVSKLLTRARECGIVKIDVSIPAESKILELESSICRALSLKSVSIFPYTEIVSDNDTPQIQALALSAGPLLVRLLADSRYVGVGWGRTMYYAASEVPYQRAKTEKLFIPMVGNSGLYNRYLQTSSIADRMSEKFGARCFYLNMSVERLRGRELSELEESTLKEVRKYWQHLDAAIFSIGSSKPVNYYLGEFPYTIIDKAEYDDNACGEILSQPFFEDGSYIGNEANCGTIAFHLSDLSAIPLSICVAAGRGKAASILAAARCGYLDTLITDSATAEELVKLIFPRE